MTIKDEKVQLINGYFMPKLAFGTYGLNKDRVESVISDALEAGYRHIETAPIYLNETGIGKAIKATVLDRDQLFITSKIPPHVKTYDGALRIAKRTMKKLDVDYLDLLLINNPVPWGDEGTDYSKENQDVWRAMETLYKEEVVGAIGVSNFTEQDLSTLLKNATVSPHVNQIGVFAGHTLDALRSFCEEKHIVVQAHSPLARGRLLKETLLVDAAKNEGRTPAQIAIRFVYELGALPIVKTNDKGRMKENLDIDTPLSKETFDTLRAFSEDVRDYLPPGAKRQL